MQLQVSVEMVWVLYYQLLLWIGTVLFPYLAIMQSFIIYILFYGYYIALNVFSEKPQSESNKDSTGIVLSSLMNASLVVWILGVTMLLTFQAPHYPWVTNPNRICGPYASGESWQ